MWTSVSPSRVGVSNSTVIRRTAIVPPSPSPSRISCSNTAPVSDRPQGRRSPIPSMKQGGPVLADDEGSRPAGRSRRGSPSCRSCGRRSTPRRAGSPPGPRSSSDRSWAWPSSQQNTSVTSIACGSSTTRALPGRAPAPMVRSSLSRCSCPGQVVAVEDLDPVARQPGRPLAAHGGDDRPEGAGRVPDQFRRDARLGAVELVVDGLERDAEGLGPGPVGGVDGGAGPWRRPWPSGPRPRRTAGCGCIAARRPARRGRRWPGGRGRAPGRHGP